MNARNLVLIKIKKKKKASANVTIVKIFQINIFFDLEGFHVTYMKTRTLSFT